MMAKILIGRVLRVKVIRNYTVKMKFERKNPLVKGNINFAEPI